MHRIEFSPIRLPYRRPNSLAVTLPVHSNSIIILPSLSRAVPTQTCSLLIPLFLTCLPLLREGLGILAGLVPLYE